MDNIRNKWNYNNSFSRFIVVALILLHLLALYFFHRCLFFVNEIFYDRKQKIKYTYICNVINAILFFFEFQPIGKDQA